MTSKTETVADLVERLRSKDHTPPVDPKAVYRTRPVALFEEAASTLTSLEAERDRLREALQEIAEMTDPDQPDSYRADDREGCLDAVHARAAALTPEPKP